MNSMSQLLGVWLDWGAFVGFAIALLVAFWVFYDAQKNGRVAILWKALSIAPPILIAPSIMYRVFPAVRVSMEYAIDMLAYLGLVSALVSLIALAGYLLNPANEERQCPTCGQALQAGWDYCPHCEHQAQTVQAESQSPHPPVFPTPTPEPPAATRPMMEAIVPAGPAVSSPAQATQVLKKRPPTFAWLVPQEGVHAGQPLPLDRVTTIGRDGTHCGIVLDDEAVARQHAKIRLQEDDQFTLFDLASVNGTLVRNRESSAWEEVARYVLQDHDEIKVGKTILTFMQVAELDRV